MHATTLISNALRGAGVAPAAPATTRAICCLTGVETDCIPRSDLIGPSFTDTHAFLAPSSRWIGVDVFIAWRYGIRGEGKKRDMRPEANQCWFATSDKFEIVKKPEIREVVLDGSPDTPWSLWVTTSYKKHGSLRAPVNSGWRGFVGFDELVVDCRNQFNVWALWQYLNEALEDGISRTVIETLDCPVHQMRKVGIRRWQEFEFWARPIYQGGLYKLLTYLLPSKEERENEKTS